MTEPHHQVITREEASRQIAADIRAYPQDGPDLREEHVRLFGALIPPQAILASWADRYAELAKPKPMVWHNGRRYDADAWEKMAANNAACSFLPSPQPTADEAREDIQEGKSQELDLEGSQSVPIGFTQSPTKAPEVADGVLCLDPAAPFDNAQKLVSLRAWHPGERIRTWQFWQKSFWQWSGMHWCEVDDDTVRASIWHELNGAEKVLKGGKRARFEPKMSDVNGMVDALKVAVNLPTSEETAMPGWFGPRRPDGDLRELVVCKNGVLHMPTRGLLHHTPRFWSPNALDIAYDHKAKAPRFKQFLEEIWPGDKNAQQCLLEMFGLCLTDVTKYQKLFMFVGPRRGGRGTIGRVLRGLIGAENYIGTSLKAFSEQFGMESFVGKKVAVFSDARLDGVLQRNLSTITERLLMITGEDEMHINRKNKKYWNGNLSTKVIIFSNELLRFQDESGALAGRCLTFRMQQSFFGREDEDLTDKLLAERPGILNLAMDALDALRSRGKLLQSDSGLEMAERLGDLTSDVKVFVDDCDVGKDFQVRVGEIFSHWQDWCAAHNIRHGWGSNQFSEKLRSVLPILTSGRPRKDNPERLTVLYGVGLKKKVPLLERTF
jgi:P4 family phage/plasmid primase-like protien